MKKDAPIVFNRMDVETAIENCNFNKAMGVDWFSGKALKNNPSIRQKLIDLLLGWLNNCQIPDYILVGKAVLLSKTGKEVADIDDSRLITVRTHLLKILEKAVMFKLQESNSDMLKVGSYQSSFTKGKRTSQNIYKMLEIVKDGRMRKAKDSILLFVDFSKAFDKVNRRLLQEILQKRSQSGTDQHCCNLIGTMLNETVNEYGSH